MKEEPSSTTCPRQSTPSPPAPETPDRASTVREIIAAGRAAPHRAPARGAWLLSGLSAVLLWASFTPLDWGPLGWVCLVPLILLIRLKQPTRAMYRAVYVGGLAFELAALQWMRLGDPAMYLAWGALSFYLAAYFPVFVGLSRTAVHRLRVPLVLAVPCVWTGLEFLRAHLLTGFAWYELGHTQYRWLELIQISDLLGAYGVSFVVAMISACLAGTLPEALLARLRLLPSSRQRAEGSGRTEPSSKILPTADCRLPTSSWLTVAVCLAVFAGVLVYGVVRRSQARFVAGPRVALVQGNFTTSVKHDPREAQRIFERHYRLTGQAVRQQPDLIVWPETMYRSLLLHASPKLSEDELTRLAPRIPPDAWRDDGVPKALGRLSTQAGAAMIIGIESAVADEQGFRLYNSAAFIKPRSGVQNRYDKLHRVIFGEYIPLREELPWLRRMTPFPEEFGIAAGQRAALFEYRGWRFAPIICFEDTVPHLVRGIVRATSDEGTPNDHGSRREAKPDSEVRTPKAVDCLVNLTNDGWFHASSELDQHLITALFRAVECRTPLVRAVNTGISAVIDGDGAIVEPDMFLDGEGRPLGSMRDPETGRWRKGMNAVLVGNVPLDDRRSLYVRWGDWFAGTCLFATMLAAAFGLVTGARRTRE